MAAANDPKVIAEPYGDFSNFLDMMSSKQKYTEIGSGWYIINAIEKKGIADGFCPDDIYKVYYDTYAKLQKIFRFEKEYDFQIFLFYKATNFIKSINKIVDKKTHLEMYTSNYFRPLLDLGRKDEAKKALLECKKTFNEIDKSLLTLEEQLQVKVSLYDAYFHYYKHPLSLNGVKMIYNGISLIKTVFNSNEDTCTKVIGGLYVVLEETIKVRAFRQTNYLLRALKVYQKSNKNDQKKEIHVKLIKSGKLPSIKCMNQLMYAKLMLKILMTMKGRAMAEEKLSQGLSLNKDEKNCFKILEDCYTFDDIEVPEADEIFDGLLKNEDEIKLIYREIQKKMKSVKASYHPRVKEDRDQCLAELKDVEKFFKLKN